jgi:type II secretory pathway pseudopilin PulG
MKILRQQGNTTLEVIAALVIFALAAAGLAVALPLAFGRAETWSEQKTLAWYLEKRMEEMRCATYENLSTGTSTLSPETLDGRRLQTSYTTSLVVDTKDADNKRIWTEISGPDANPIKGLLGTYYDHSDFTGASMIRVDPEINIPLSTPPIGTDNTFSVRWTGFIEAPATAAYTFYINCSTTTQAKLMLNDTILIGPAATVKSGTVSFTEGKKYKITMEIVQSGASSRVQLCWQSSAQIVPEQYFYNNLPKKVDLTVTNVVSGTAKTGRLLLFPPYLAAPLAGEEETSGDIQGLAGLYFNSINFDSVNPNSPYSLINTYSRIDPKIEFNWWDSSLTDPKLLLPNGIGPDNFTIRWTGYLTPRDNASYYFYTTARDGVKLWINHSLIINTWDSHNVDGWNGWSGTYLSNDQLHTVTLDYHYHAANPGNASTFLQWNKDAHSTVRETIPGVVLYPVFSPVEDSYVDSLNQATHYGTGTDLWLSKSGSNSKSIYLKFKLAGMASKTVQAATLRLYYKSTSSKLSFKVKQINLVNSDDPAWKERTLNYHLAQGLSGSNEENFEMSPANGYIDILLNPALFNAGNGVYSLALEPAGPNDYSANFYSRESEFTTSVDRGPRLTLLFKKSPEQNKEIIGISYMCKNSNVTTGTLQPWFRITNNGTTPLDLSQLKIRYWYTRESSAAQISVCDHAGINSGISYTNITNEVSIRCYSATTPSPDADYYMEIAFAKQHYVPAGAYVELQNRIYNQDWTAYSQSNDYSFNASIVNSFAENAKVTAYSGEVLFSGVEP